jgi:hypothetical protein
VEWFEHQVTWRWLQDSYEGGSRYRNAIYGVDHRGLPVRNLIRHKREYPNPREQAFTGSSFPAIQTTMPPLGARSGISLFPGQLGADPAALATDDPYEYRRARTPVPRFAAQAANLHLARIFAREVHREGPGRLDQWWKDVDGCGTSIDDWMRETIGPLLLVCGNLDLVFDHPENRSGVPVESQAAQKALGLDRCVAGYILPDNMLWWQLDSARRYTECLVREYHDTPEGGTVERFRYWNATESTLYDLDGHVLKATLHCFGRVPIVRLRGVPKFRCRNVGQSDYEEIAEIQREFYNRDSELVLSDSLQAHPLLQGPEDYCKADSEVTIGPDYLLPKKKSTSGGNDHYEPFEFLEPPKGGAESIRQNKADLREEVDRAACLAKPPGAAGGRSVGQSGISKQLDQVAGNDLLARLAAQLARAERLMAEFVLLVQDDRSPTPQELDGVRIVYPTEFDLYSALDLASVITEFQGILSASGETPDTEFQMLFRLVQLILPGLDDQTYQRMRDELKAYLLSRARASGAGEAQTSEAPTLVPPAPPPPDETAATGSTELSGSTTPTVIPSLDGNANMTGGLYAYPL